MKKITTLLVAVLTVTGSALFAQAGESKIGFKAGFNFSNFHGDDIEDTKMKLGFHVGGFATVPFGNISFQPELLISTRGAKEEGLNLKGEKADFTKSLMYVDVPLLLKFYLSDNINLYAGPQVGFLLAATQKEDPEPEDYDDDASDRYSSIDFGAAVGLEYDTDFGFVVGARYYYGLSSIGKDYEEETTVTAGNTTTTTKVEFEAADIKNNMIQLYVGIGF